VIKNSTPNRELSDTPSASKEATASVIESISKVYGIQSQPGDKLSATKPAGMSWPSRTTAFTNDSN